MAANFRAIRGQGEEIWEVVRHGAEEHVRPILTSIRSFGSASPQSVAKAKKGTKKLLQSHYSCTSNLALLVERVALHYPLELWEGSSIVPSIHINYYTNRPLKNQFP